MDNIYFFDSYAVMEIIKGNPNYREFLDKNIVLTKENIFEIYLSILRQMDKETADDIFEEYYPYVIDFEEDVIKEAAELKLRYYKRNISMTDCIGYILAMKLGIKFLTGDKEFESFENVEFVK
jgi:predicted nucleic acid-binding protein